MHLLRSCMLRCRQEIHVFLSAASTVTMQLTCEYAATSAHQRPDEGDECGQEDVERSEEMRVIEGDWRGAGRDSCIHRANLFREKKRGGGEGILLFCSHSLTLQCVENKPVNVDDDVLQMVMSRSFSVRSVKVGAILLV